MTSSWKTIRTPVEWYEISHDGYLSAERGFLDFLKTFLIENPNPPKTVAEFVKLMACPPDGGWCWLRIDASSSDKFGNWNPGPYTTAADGGWKTSTGYSYRVRLRAGKRRKAEGEALARPSAQDERDYRQGDEDDLREDRHEVRCQRGGDV